jgi:uncharacterized membrane protein
MKIQRSLPAVVVALSMSALLHAATQASCTFETFSAPEGYTLSQVQGISDDGTVVGQLVNKQSLRFIAFKRSASGTITLYAAPQSSSTWLYGRSGIGVESGFYQDSVHPEQVHGFLLQDGKFTPVNHPKVTNTWLFNVNQLGAAVGSFSGSASLVRGFLLLNGNYTVIAYPEAQTTYALSINDNGDVVGTYASGPVSNGFLWKDGTFTTINYPNSKYGTVLTGVNNAGVIVGNHLSIDRDLGFMLKNGEYKGIVYPGANYTTAGGINNNGLISGQIHLADKSALGYTAVCE